MCFPIKKDAKRWRETTVFKVLRTCASGGFCSPQAEPFRRTYYASGRLVAPNRFAEQTCERSSLPRTQAGIYVCRTLKAARRYAGSIGGAYDTVIMELRVKPVNFLFAADGRMDRDYLACATYCLVECTDVIHQV